MTKLADAAPKGPVTGDSVEDVEKRAKEAEQHSPFACLSCPVVVFVADPSVSMSDYDNLEEVVFKNEKVGLAMRAFRAVRMAPADVDADPILQGEGKDVPRVLIVDPSKEKVRSLEGSKIKASTLYTEMQRAADRFYDERLDKIVKDHLKLLTERDQLYNQTKTLGEKKNRLAEKGDKAQKDIEEVEAEIKEVEADLEKLAVKEKEMWKLTPKKAAA